MDETCHRCRNLVVDALKQAGIDPDTKLVGLGLSLSGCEVADTMEQLRVRYPPMQFSHGFGFLSPVSLRLLNVDTPPLHTSMKTAFRSYCYMLHLLQAFVNTLFGRVGHYRFVKF